jgi:hypothetical protein
MTPSLSPKLLLVSLSFNSSLVRSKDRKSEFRYAFNKQNMAAAPVQFIVHGVKTRTVQDKNYNGRSEEMIGHY